jgi:DNA-binding NtrC family response regulator
MLVQFGPLYLLQSTPRTGWLSCASPMKSASPRIAVCALGQPDVERATRLAEDACDWSIIPVDWCSSPTPDAMTRDATAYLLLCSGGVPPSSLLETLSTRPSRAPLVVIGPCPAQSAAPTCWLPTFPSARFVGQLLEHLVADDAELGVDATTATTSTTTSDLVIGRHPAIRQLLHSLEQLAPSTTPVIITGEPGVGKELIARALHESGPRAKEPFVVVDCAVIPENRFEDELLGYPRTVGGAPTSIYTGAFEAAQRGTLFLDDIDEMPLAAQAKLLRTLETGEIPQRGAAERKRASFRLVTATPRSLERAVKEGRFREDLYYRVRVYPLHVPPLRERIEDLPALVSFHLARVARRTGLPAPRLQQSALEKLMFHAWPGNCGELVDVLEQAILLAEDGVVHPHHILLPTAVPPPPLESYKTAKQRFEHAYFSELMNAAGGNVSRASKLGKKTRKEVYDALKRLGLDAERYRRSDA